MLATQLRETATAQRFAAASVLIVSETPAAKNLQTLLEAAGCEVFAANDSITAVRVFERENCDLVLLESAFSEVRPIGLCEVLRSKTGASYLPIIVFASEIENENEQVAFDCEADDFWRVSLSETEILWRLERHVSQTRTQRALANRNRQTAFLADLGQNLLVTLEPEQALTQTAAATYEVTGAAVCAVVAEVSGGSPTVASFNREGSAEGATEIFGERLRKWLRGADNDQPVLLKYFDEFLLSDEFHAVEYVAPMIVGERTKGAIVVGFDAESDCTPEIQKIIEEAAHLAAMSVHITSLYESALGASVYLAQEEQKRFTESILDSLPLSIYAIDRDFRIVAWNRHRELGKQGIPREAAIGRIVFDVLPRQPREILEREFEKAFVTGQIERVEQKTSDENGAVKHWLVSKIPMRDASGAVSHVISVGEDITARVEATYAVARAEKLAAVGRLAAGVVHEINNPLATIAACAEALEARVEEGSFGASAEVEDLRDYLVLIRSEAFRCKSITNGLLDFSRARSGHRVAVNLAEIVRSSANLVGHQKRNGSKIEIRVEVEDLPAVFADEGQIQQAIIALATNAIDAMPDGGRLTFRASVRRHRVFLEVEDSGGGIPPENIAKIFEPFFTTKEVGSGTGLGLAVCYGIVTEHGGSLNVRSTVGIGSTFTISLPIKP